MAIFDFKKRSFVFAVNTGRLIAQLPSTNLNRAYISQLVRSSSSIGANYRAAKRAKSTADFINKLKIAEEEADESIYFLELLLAFNPLHENTINALINEATELLKIIVASIITKRSNNQSQ